MRVEVFFQYAEQSTELLPAIINFLENASGVAGGLCLKQNQHHDCGPVPMEAAMIIMQTSVILLARVDLAPNLKHDTICIPSI